VLLSGWLAHARSTAPQHAPGGPPPPVTAGPVAQDPNGPENPPTVGPKGWEQVETWSVHYSSHDQLNYYHTKPGELRELLGIPPDGPVYLCGAAQSLDVFYVHMASCALICIDN